MIQELSQRNREIFRQLVEAYMETGEPIGSHTLAKKLGVALSPATIRNVMAELQDAGLLFSPTLRPAACRRRRGFPSSSTACWKSAT